MEAAGNNYIVCNAEPELIEGLVLVNYTAWQETYRGIIHDTYLDTLTHTTYTKRWQHIIQNRNEHSFVLAALNPEGKVVGYCMAGTIMEPYKSFDAEVYALYLLKNVHGLGIGGRLFKEAMQRLQKMNYQSVCLFVLKQNPTLAFYRHYRPDFEELEKVTLGGVEYDDVALGWTKLSKFL